MSAHQVRALRRVRSSKKFNRTCTDHRTGSSQACGRAVETLEGRLLLSANPAVATVISSLTDPFTGTSVDTTKWNETTRGLENNGPAGYDAPTEDPTNGLTLGGTTQNSYWYGNTLESQNVFSSSLPTTVSVERVALNGTGSAYRSSLWLIQPNSGGQYLHFAQDVGETAWEYNQSNTGSATGSGNAIAAFNATANDGGDHVMKLVYTPQGGTDASIGIYLDGVLGTTVTYTNWDNSQPFEVAVTGQARAAGDTVSAQFKNFDAEAGTASTAAPAAPTNLAATIANGQVNLHWTDNATDELSYHVERSTDNVNFTEVATVPGVAGAGTTLTYTDSSADTGTTFYYRVRAFNSFNGGTYSAYSNVANVTTPAGLTSLIDPFTGTSVDATKWNITGRGLESNGDAGYNAPTEDPSTGLTLGGTASQQYWFGSSLESNGLFSSRSTTTVSVERVSLDGAGSAYRSALWILQPGTGGQYLHFAQDVGESGWEYNQSGTTTATGGGTAIAPFNTAANDGGDHLMKLVYTPLGGTNATVDIYLDGVLGTTVTYNNWDNARPFEVIVTGEARAAGDSVTSVFKNFDAEVPQAGPNAPTNLTATAAAHGTGITLQWTDNANNELNYRIERSTDGTNFTEIATVNSVQGSGGVGTYTDFAPGASTKFYYRVRAFNSFSGGTFSAYSNVASATTAGTITSLTDPFASTTVNTAKWNITGRGLESNGPSSLDAPTEDPSAGLILGGIPQKQYWFGSSLESVDEFSSALPTTVTVDRVSLSGLGTAWRSALWLFQPNTGGQYLHFAQDVNETGWEYNQSNTGGGTAIAPFNTTSNDGGDHVMKLVYTPEGGTDATVDIYLDGVLGATVNYTNWDNAAPFRVILSGEARASQDQVEAEFKSFDAEAGAPATAAPAAPTNLQATASGNQVTLTFNANTANALGYHVERSTDNQTFTDIGAISAAAIAGGVGTFVDSNLDVGQTYYYRVRAFGDAGGGTYSAYSNVANATTVAALTSLVDPFTGTAVDSTKWNITGRGLENNGNAGLDAPAENPSTGLTLGGTANQQYWFGDTLESQGLFSSHAATTVSVERVSLSGTGTAYRSALWIIQPNAGGQYLHFAQDTGETGWEYNQSGTASATGSGTAIAPFNATSNNGGDHVMKLVYTPLGGTNAKIDIYLDGVLGTTVTYTNWDNTKPFIVAVSGETRASGDTVQAVFKNFNAQASPIAQNIISDTTGGQTITLKQIAGNLVQWTMGTQVGTLPISDANGLTINDSGAQDTLVLDNSGGNALPGTLVLNGRFAINGFNSTVNTLTKLDIEQSTVSVNYSGASPLAALQAALKAGTITSSRLTAGQAVADVDTGSAVTLALRHLGDADGQNGVGFADLLLLAQHYGQSGQNWATGDFNYDGTVNFADLLILAQNYGQGGSPAAASVPAAASDSLDLVKRRRSRA